MRVPRTVLAVLVAMAAFSATMSCTGSEEVVSRLDIDRAQHLLQPFKRDLKGALLEGLEDGPRAAIMVCKSAAPAIAARRVAEGVEMGRTSHKVRNPANAPAAWMEPMLDAYDAGAQDTHMAMHLPNGRVGYVEPIYVQKPCLMCHGQNIAPGIAEQIAAEYPNDQATGFREGEFRGLFWLTMPAGREDE